MLTALMLLAASVSMTTLGIAQRPVSLVHGFGDVADRWYSAQLRLQQEFGNAVTVNRPQLGNVQAISAQATQLEPWVPSTGSLAIAVGHSAGGVVSRELDRGANRDLFGVITVGTPHTGAPVAANEGLAVGFFTQFAFDILLPVNIYWGGYGDHQAMAAAVDAAVVVAAAIAYWNRVQPLLSSAAAIDLRPTSALLSGAAGLNSSANTAREAAAMGPRRVSLIGTMPAAQQLCASISPNYVDTCFWTFDAVGDGFYGLWLYYSNYVDYNDPWMYAKRANAYSWLPAATALWYGANDDWCAIIGAIGCYADGFIPVDRQHWPGATNILIPGSTPHEVEPERTIVQDRIVAELRSTFGL
jgi:hypothetical protein